MIYKPPLHLVPHPLMYLLLSAFVHILALNGRQMWSKLFSQQHHSLALKNEERTTERIMETIPV